MSRLLDEDALHVAFASLIYGYMVLRDQLAGELDVDADKLDEQVAATIERLMRALGDDEVSNG